MRGTAQASQGAPAPEARARHIGNAQESLRCGLVRSGDKRSAPEIFRFIGAHQAELLIRVMCRVLKVSPSGYYAWRNHTSSKRAQDHAMLTEKTHAIHARSRGTYGAPRVHAASARRRYMRGQKARGSPDESGRPSQERLMNRASRQSFRSSSLIRMASRSKFSRVK